MLDHRPIPANSRVCARLAIMRPKFIYINKAVADVFQIAFAGGIPETGPRCLFFRYLRLVAVCLMWKSITFRSGEVADCCNDSGITTPIPQSLISKEWPPKVSFADKHFNQQEICMLKIFYYMLNQIKKWMRYRYNQHVAKDCDKPNNLEKFTTMRRHLDPSP